jgi:hypothetical protein
MGWRKASSHKIKPIKIPSFSTLNIHGHGDGGMDSPLCFRSRGVSPTVGALGGDAKSKLEMTAQ